MKNAKLWIAASLAMLSALCSATLITKTVDYELNGAKLQGYLAYDDSKTGWRNVVLVFHDWDGINDYEKMRCRMLAQEGYVAFAPDIFGKDAKVDTIEERQALTQKFYNDPLLFRERAKKGWEIAQKVKNVAHNKTVAIGYCFGGGSALELARSGIDMKGVVTFHGSLATSKPMIRDHFHGQILVLTGGADPFVPESQVSALQAEMKQAGVPVRVVTYPGVGHAFTVKGSEKMGLKGVAYDANADAASWKELLQFLKEALK